MSKVVDFAETLERRTGMTLESLGGARSLALAMRRCAEAAGFSSEDEWRQEALHSPSLWAAFIHAVIVPETFFFRYPESFQALTDWVTQHKRSPWRILCLPCSTGEEAYSVAITLSEAGLPWEQFSILAVDIDARSVQQAQAGEYRRASSVRSVPTVATKHYWTDLPEGGFVIDPAVRDSITFRTQNLWDLPGENGVFDIIFCRNLLIYFSEENQKFALEKLGRLLTPSGLLFLGPAEAAVASKFGWSSAGYAMGFACRRDSVKETFSTPPIARKPVFRRVLPASVVRSVRPADKAVTTPVPSEPTLNQIRGLADRGDFLAARKRLTDYLQISPNDADALVLEGILSESLGENSRAEASFRQAIYLNPEHTEAMAHLALLLEADGRLQAARKLRERAERITIR